MIPQKQKVKPRIIELHQTCWSCPAQWQGRTDDGRHVYIRYRWGCLSMGVGQNKDMAVSNAIADHPLELGDEYHGEMTESDMMQTLSHKLDFSGVKA